MAQRTVCMCYGEYIGIETIYTVVDGQQINIPDKLNSLRAKSRNNELFCPCGCGANLVLVAGDRNLREQHFRIKDGEFEGNCHMVTEGKTSVDSKIVLKCWLDDKLQVDDIQSRVPINHINDSDRKYELTFLSKIKGIALSYCHERVNLSTEKFEILEGNSRGIKIIYVVDAKNGGCSGQYPEALMRVQDKQGYCLLLYVSNINYAEAVLKAVYYNKNEYGLWEEIELVSGNLKEYEISGNGLVSYGGKSIDDILTVYLEKLEEIKKTNQERLEAERLRREEEHKRFLEEEEKRKAERQKQQEELQRKREEEKLRLQRLEEERQAELKRREEDFKRNMAENFSQQTVPVKDAEGNRWIKCEFCGLIAKDNKFVSYGGMDKVNLGICKKCSAEGKIIVKNIKVSEKKPRKKYDPMTCPECGGKLRERNGRNGRFIGCSNYPECRYTRNIRG